MRATLRILIPTLLLSILFPCIVQALEWKELMEEGIGKIGDITIHFGPGGEGKPNFVIVKDSQYEKNKISGYWFFVTWEEGIDHYHARVKLFDSKIRKEAPCIVKGQQVAEIQVERRLTRDGGVRIEEWVAPTVLIAGKQTSFVLQIPLDGNGIRINRYGKESSDYTIVSYPGMVYVMIRPDYRSAAEKWFSNRGYIFRRSHTYFEEYMKRKYGKNVLSWWTADEDIDKREKILEFYNLKKYQKIIDYQFFHGGSEERFNNLYKLQVPIGNEIEEVKELLKQKWVLDAVLDHHAEGPGDYYAIHFPYKSIFNNTGDQQKFRQKLISVLKKKFNSIPVSPDNVVVFRPGLSYKFKLKAPMSELGNRDFKGYWLKADVTFGLLHTSVEEKMEDVLLIAIPDGFLALWDKAGEPPDGHFDHLSPEGEGKYRDFTALKWLLETIINDIASEWNGTVGVGGED